MANPLPIGRSVAPVINTWIGDRMVEVNLFVKDVNLDTFWLVPSAKGVATFLHVRYYAVETWRYYRISLLAFHVAVATQINSVFLALTEQQLSSTLCQNLCRLDSVTLEWVLCHIIKICWLMVVGFPTKNRSL